MEKATEQCRGPKESRIRESNPPPRLGKPMHYRCANPAVASANIGKIFVIDNISLNLQTLFISSIRHP